MLFEPLIEGFRCVFIPFQLLCVGRVSHKTWLRIRSFAKDHFYSYSLRLNFTKKKIPVVLLGVKQIRLIIVNIFVFEAVHCTFNSKLFKVVWQLIWTGFSTVFPLNCLQILVGTNVPYKMRPLALVFCTLAVASAHVSLTFPPARKYDLDFLDTFR